MNWFTQSRQRCLGLLAMLALVLALALSACGSPANAANPSAPASKPNSGTQQYPPSNSGSSTQSSNKATNADQQIQSLLRQLDGAHSDVNNADNGASQDGGQP